MSKAPLADKGTPKFVDIGDNEPTGAIRVFSLNDEIVPKDVAEHIQLGEHNLRRETADRIIGLFVRINAATLLTFLVLFVSDVWLIHSGSENRPNGSLIAALLRC